MDFDKVSAASLTMDDCLSRVSLMDDEIELSLDQLNDAVVRLENEPNVEHAEMACAVSRRVFLCLFPVLREIGLAGPERSRLQELLTRAHSAVASLASAGWPDCLHDYAANIERRRRAIAAMARGDIGTTREILREALRS